jgi:hypothetical protein
MPVRYDGSRLSKARRTPQGYIRVDGWLSKVGVQTYRQPDGTVRRELRHPDDVFSAASLATADVGTPITIGHPGLLDAHNTAQHRVGSLTKQGRADGQRVATEFQVETADAIARVDSGELCECSAGYTVDLDETPGVWEGKRYDARQVNIVLNHVALLPRGHGRAGSDVGLRLDAADAVYCEDIADDEETMKKKIRLDGVEIEVDANVADALDLAQRSRAEAEKALGAAEAKAADLQKRLDAASDPKALDERVAARVELVSQAQRVLGGEYTGAGKTARQVHEDVLKKVRSDAKFDGRSDEYVAGAFESAVAREDSGERAPGALELELLAGKRGKREDADDVREDALDVDAEYEASVARKRGEKPAKK